MFDKMFMLMVLYTANLAGRLDRLPRLFTHLRRVREEVTGELVLFDLGGSCDPAVPECAITQGRAVLLVLDAIGYDAAYLSAADCALLDEATAAKLAAETTLPLCAADERLGFPGVVTQTFDSQQIVFAAGDAPPDVDATLIVRPAAGDVEPWFDKAARTLWLAPPPDDMIGLATLGFNLDGTPVASKLQYMALPNEMPPDPTAAAAVDFVRDEVRLYQKHHPEGGADAAS